MQIKPPFLTALFAYCFVVLCAPGTFAQSRGGERITLFESDIEVHRDATMTVTETIYVEARGQKIKRGIYRDFPTIYPDGDGNRIQVGFEILDVRRGGKKEPYRITNLSNGKRIRIGNSSVLLDPGPHVYTITYKTDRQLGFFAEHDQLYWNVTGNGWNFSIDKAKATVTLPTGTKILEIDGFVGRAGSRERSWRLLGRPTNLLTFETYRTLRKNEGFTIAVSFNKGAVSPPSLWDKARYFARDNIGLVTAFFGLFCIFLYYLQCWNLHGRDPKAGVIIPRYKPPTNLSPGAARMTRRMGYDKKAYTAALISLAVKGVVEIEEIKSEDDSYRVKKRPNPKIHTTSRGERALLNALFSTEESVWLSPSNHYAISRSVARLEKTLKDECEDVYFKSNHKLFTIGALISAAVLFVSAVLTPKPLATLFQGFVAAGLTAILGYLLIKHYGNRLGIVTGAPVMGMPLKRTLKSIVVFVLIPLSLITTSWVLSTVTLFDITQINLIQGIHIYSLAALAAVNIFFYFLLKAPTVIGQKCLEELEGFRAYLSVAEKARLNLLNPPKKTPELFEKYLPYALALDVENEWAEQFAHVLANASITPGQEYQPIWYRGSNWNSDNPTRFTRSLSTKLADTISSAAVSPGSSSGLSNSGGLSRNSGFSSGGFSGGGGSSGGGGGGGGGGGW